MRTVAAVLALVACVHAGIWALLRPESKAPDFTGQLASISYAPFVNSSHPDSGERPTEDQIRADLKAIAPYTRAIRTYSATGGADEQHTQQKTRRDQRTVTGHRLHDQRHAYCGHQQGEHECAGAVRPSSGHLKLSLRPPDVR